MSALSYSSFSCSLTPVAISEEAQAKAAKTVFVDCALIGQEIEGNVALSSSVDYLIQLCSSSDRLCFFCLS